MVESGAKRILEGVKRQKKGECIAVPPQKQNTSNQFIWNSNLSKFLDYINTCAEFKINTVIVLRRRRKMRKQDFSELWILPALTVSHLGSTKQ